MNEGATDVPNGPAHAGRKRVRPTDRTLREQMLITDLQIERRKAMLRFTSEDVDILTEMYPIVKQEIADIVAKFYEQQTAIPEIALVIGDAETLKRLQKEMHAYVLDLFSGQYGADYVNKRLRIGLVHKRIGVGPKLYLAGMLNLRALLHDRIGLHTPAEREAPGLRRKRFDALEKLMFFDVALVFDTYVRTLMAELENSRDATEQYAANLEAVVEMRTQQLRALARVDSLTGLTNRRVFNEELAREMKIAKRTKLPVSLVYFDLDGFKSVNDESGHAEGDRLLTAVGEAVRRAVREGETACRLGGDEFAIIMPRVALEEAEFGARRIAEEIQKTGDPRIGLSIGVAQAHPGEPVSPEELLRRADVSMYRAKSNRRGNGADASVRIVHYDDSLTFMEPKDSNGAA
ncbi:MAG: GGDEF domain-containing protein [Alphaproteobacteria bacterium]